MLYFKMNITYKLLFASNTSPKSFKPPHFLKDGFNVIVEKNATPPKKNHKVKQK